MSARSTWTRLAFLWLCALVASPAWGAFDNSTPRGTFAGTHNYLATGNTLRTQPNSVNACSVGTSSTAVVSGIPAGATISAAYLYWGGSGATVDSNVTFGPNGSMVAVAADATFTNPIPTDTRSYFGGFKNVTSQVAGNGTYQFGGLTVDTSAAYCNPQAVVAAWALIVVYAHSSEPYRFSRVYDGLQFFRGSSVTTTQSGFRVPDLVDGKVTIVTWEGDDDLATSTTLDGFDEELRFDGYPLLNTNCESVNNVYNSSISTPSSCSTAHGVDIDTYDVTSFLYEGQTGASLFYSSGNDRVFLTAQVISTTNTPVADVGITKTHVGDFTAGQNGSFQVVVRNFGPEIATGTATVTDVLPTGLTFVSGSGTGWSCSAAGQTVTCANSAPSIAVDTDLPTLTINVAVSGSAPASLQNTATVSHPMFDGTGGNQSSTDTVTVRRSNLSTSTKTVSDVNGGQVNPGDTLRYTITLTDTGNQSVAASGVSVVDDLPLHVGGLTVVSIPAGATNLSVGSGGVNGTGQVKVTGINIPSGGSAQIVFDVTIAGTAGAGSTITNTAVVTNPSGPGGSPSVGINVAASAPPASGNKRLYLNNGSPNTLTRVPRTSAGATTTLEGNGATATWNLTGALTKALTLGSNVTLDVRLSSSSQGGGSRVLTYQLLNGASVIGTYTAPSTTFSTNAGAPSAIQVTIPVTTPLTLSAASVLSLRITNGTGTDNANRQLTVHDWTAAGASFLSFSTPTVVNVDTVDFYSDSALTTVAGNIAPGAKLHVRAVVSDPFGGYDVSGARLTLTDPNGVVRVANLPMVAHTSPTNDGATATRVFKYEYEIPANPAYGNWIAAVTATEGTETPALATHTGNGIYSLMPDALSVVKSHSGNFIAGTNNAYTLTVQNTGAGTVTGTTTVTDTLTTGLTFVSAAGTGWTCGATGQAVTCTSTTAIPGSSALPPITLTVAVAGNMGASVDNKASVGNSSIAGGFMTDGNTDTATILHPNLSTSTKTVVDIDGGDADPGDALRYTITLKESANVPASGIGVVDNISGSLENFVVNAGLTTCNGTDASTSVKLERTGISLAAGGTCVIVFDVTISAVAGTGLEINNTATITNPAGPGATPAAPTVVVSATQQPASGNKYLYVYANQTMSRVPHTTTGTTAIAAASSQSFTLPGVAKQLVITPGSQVQVYLWLQRTGDATNTTRSVYVQLLKNGSNQIGVNSAPINFSGTGLVRQQFTINVPSLGGAGTLNPGDTLVLRVFNSTVGANRSVGLGQWVNTGSDVPARSSLVSLTTATVVNVDDMATYAEGFPSVVTRAAHSANDTIYFRATISDPFGGADVGSARISITDNNGVVRKTNEPMAIVATGTTTRTFEYAYLVPADAQVGNWTASVTGHEGTEGMVSHTGNFPFGVGVSRLTLAKSHVGNFVRGGTGSYSLLVHNNGLALAGTKTVADTLPTGLTYVSASGTGWSCGAAGQVVTCTNSTSIPASGDLPVLTINVAVANDAAASVDNIASVAHPSVNSGTPQNSNTDTTLIVSPDLSTSTKTVVDLNGGDADPGDTLRYTVLLAESAGAAVSGASVVDEIPAGVTGFTVVSVPPGATNSSTGVGTGANGTGRLNVTGIGVAANGSASVVFDVVIGPSLDAGDTIDNTATITNPSGTGATPSAPTVVVSQSGVVASGNKKLYVNDTLVLDRTPNGPGATSGVTIGSGGTQTWTLSPAIPTGEQLVLTAGTINVDLVISTDNTVNLVVQLFDGATQIGNNAAQSFQSNTPTVRPFQVTLPADYTLDAGDQLRLVVSNNSNGNKNATIHEYSGAGSEITFATSTVVNVDAITDHSEPYATGNTSPDFYTHGDTVWIRAVASDPFGGADVSAAEITITDAAGAVLFASEPMAVVATSAAARTFEFELEIPASGAAIGNWTVSVTAHEGSEGTVSHTQGATFEVRGTVELDVTWGTANAGDSVDLTIIGGLTTVAGSSTAAGTTTPATATAAAGASITLQQAFTVGTPSGYTIVLACARTGGGSLPVTGTGLSRQFTMPTDSSVICTWNNAITVPLTIVKLSTVHWDPFNESTNPKAIPGAVVEYQIVVANPATGPIDADTVVVTDTIPANVDMRVADITGAGSGPVAFADGATTSMLTYTFTSLADQNDDLEFSDDNGVSWNYVPQPDASGVDASVTGFRVNPKGVFAPNNAQFTLRFRVVIQ